MPWDWTDSKEDLLQDVYFSETGNGTIIAMEYGLQNPEPVMCSTRRSGESMYIFQSGGTFYLWNKIDNSVFTLDSVTSKENLVKTLQEGGTAALQATLLVPES